MFMADTEMSKKKTNYTARDLTLNDSVRWLFEHELLGSQQAQQALYFNIVNQSSAIKDTETLIDQYQKKMLIYVELKWWAFMTNKRDLAEQIMDVVQQALPAYGLRVIFNLQTFEKAKKLLEENTGEMLE